LWHTSCTACGYAKIRRQLEARMHQAHMHRITLSAPARLHLGFLDLHGGLGRNFGGLGLTLAELATRIHVERAAELRVEGPAAVRAEKFARRLLDQFGAGLGARISIEETIPAHVGLGSGTQLSLAIGTALSRLYDWRLDTRAIAALADRGARSGIGIGAFDGGGFLVDGGRARRGEPPRIVARVEFPGHWRVLLIFDRQLQGLHGEAELAAFCRLPEFPAATAGELCRLTLMQVLPALLDGDFEGFSRAIGCIQRSVGDHFAPAQGGRYASPRVAEVLAWIEAQGITGIGQSSWGPTGFALLASETQAHSIARAAQARWGNDGTLSLQICTGLNRGAIIDTLNHEERRTARHNS
jgi:beta-ribofuranosylaminobenzene 5'-phosphate synthase